MALTLSPSDALNFTLSRGVLTPRSIMTLTNNSNEYVAFKVGLYDEEGEVRSSMLGEEQPVGWTGLEGDEAGVFLATLVFGSHHQPANEQPIVRGGRNPGQRVCLEILG